MRSWGLVYGAAAPAGVGVALSLAALLSVAGCPAPPAGTDAASCDACAVEGMVSCGAGGASERLCVRDTTSGCLVLEETLCADGDQCEAGTGCVPCSGPTGTFSNSSIDVLYDDGTMETRFYFLHVPDAYACATPWPALFDHHGTAGGAAPEEAYALPDAIATADREGYVFVRPRSRSSLEGGMQIYRWDQNPGDLEKNAAFVRQLVDLLGTRYRLDPDRLYACGFSSGTNVTTVLASDPTSPFAGYGHFGGGSWTTTALPPEATGTRWYLTTGLRDYMRTYNDQLLALLADAAVPAAQILVRDTDTGHELYAWMYDEMWPWLDRGEAPPAGALAANWTEETLPAAAGAVAAAAWRGDGTLVASGDDAGLWARDAAAGTWTPITATGTTEYASEALSALCFGGPSAYAFAAGNTLSAESTDAGASYTFVLVPDVSASPFTSASIHAAACDPALVVVGGYWFGAATSDGTVWTDVDFAYPYGRAMVAHVRTSSWGTWVAAGYYSYIGRSLDGVAWDDRPAPPSAIWIDGVAPVDLGTWVAVAEDGQVLRSTDDGVTWTTAASGPGEHLYAVSFRDASVGLAVGRRGAALLSVDGGATWSDVSSGVDRALTDVVWLAGGTALVPTTTATALHFDPGL